MALSEFIKCYNNYVDAVSGNESLDSEEGVLGEGLWFSATRQGSKKAKFEVAH